MTSIDSTPGDGPQDMPAFEQALHACRGALRASMDESTSVAALKLPLRDVCAAARRANLPPERVIVDLKRILRDESRLAHEHADAVREQVVALAIAEYYSDRSPG